MEIFRFQYSENTVYQQYCRAIGVAGTESIRCVREIPFLPIELFKTHRVLTQNNPPAITFRSSGTSGSTHSLHHVSDISLYETSLVKNFEPFYGKPENYCLLALLPSYLERDDSSLVFMVQKIMQLSGNPNNGFFLYNHHALAKAIETSIAANQPTILIGVSFGLLQFSQNFPLQLPENFIVMETGGMKGRGREMVRQELHNLLMSRFGITAIHSEYGMTELLSQAYSKCNGIFYCPPWMRIEIRDTNDPFSREDYFKTGGINVIDLANVYSCSFIETQDLGRKHPDGGFEVLGRFDQSETRGCNLMIS